MFADIYFRGIVCLLPVVSIRTAVDRCMHNSKLNFVILFSTAKTARFYDPRNILPVRYDTRAYIVSVTIIMTIDGPRSFRNGNIQNASLDSGYNQTVAYDTIRNEGLSFYREPAFTHE